MTDKHDTDAAALFYGSGLLNTDVVAVAGNVHPKFETIDVEGTPITVVTNGRELVGGPIDSDEARLIAGSVAQAISRLEVRFPTLSGPAWPSHIPVPSAIAGYCVEIHADNVRAGWWSDPKTGVGIARNVGELLMLVVSEVREGWQGLEGGNLKDDKLPHREMLEVELADALIREYDIAGAHGLDIAGAVTELLILKVLGNRSGLFMAIIDEICDAMEGHRKGAMSTRLPHRSAFEVGLAAALIRIYDMGNMFGYDLTAAIAEKRAFNATRADHKPENRAAPGGKAY